MSQRSDPSLELMEVQGPSLRTGSQALASSCKELSLVLKHWVPLLGALFQSILNHRYSYIHSCSPLSQRGMGMWLGVLAKSTSAPLPGNPSLYYQYEVWLFCFLNKLCPHLLFPECPAISPFSHCPGEALFCFSLLLG